MLLFDCPLLWSRTLADAQGHHLCSFKSSSLRAFGVLEGKYVFSGSLLKTVKHWSPGDH